MGHELTSIQDIKDVINQVLLTVKPQSQTRTTTPRIPRTSQCPELSTSLSMVPPLAPRPPPSRLRDSGDPSPWCHHMNTLVRASLPMPSTIVSPLLTQLSFSQAVFRSTGSVPQTLTIRPSSKTAPRWAVSVWNFISESARFTVERTGWKKSSPRS